MPLTPRKHSQYVSRSTSAARLRFLDNTCDSMNQRRERDQPGPSTSNLCLLASLAEASASTSSAGSPGSATVSQDVGKLEKNTSAYIPCSTENHCCTLLHGLQELRKSNTLCDYTLIADGQKIPVHRVVMVACSDYFRVMMTGVMRESREEIVELKGVTAGGLSVVVDFAYTGRLELTTDNVEEVLSAASHLQIGVAVELCSKYLEMALTTDNCTDILNLAQMYSLTSTQTKALQYMMDNFMTVSASEQFFKLTHTQLALMLRDNSLCVPSEYSLFKIVLRWIDADKGDRTQHLAELMCNIRLPLLAGEELVEKVSKVDLMKTSPECNELLTEAKDYHIVVGKQPLLQTSRTQVRSNNPSIVISHGQNLESYTFHNKNHGFLRDPPIPLFNPSVAVLDNFMYACGGKYDSAENNEIATARCFRYDPRFDSWYELASMNEARKDFVVVAYDGKIYAVGGQDENMVMCTVEYYTVASEDWEMCASISHSCYGHAGALCGNKIYISGGQRFSGCAKNMSVFTPALNLWEEKTPMLNGRCNHVMMEVQEKLYVIGGNIEDSYGFPVPIIAMEFYCPQTDQWSMCKTNCNIREAGAATLNDKIFIVGGINGEHYYSDLLQEYDPSSDKMTIVERYPTRVYGRSCCVLTLPHFLSGIGGSGFMSGSHGASQLLDLSGGPGV
ncbi:kelch-like protein 26 [Plakobranchus ocellatus]|uniref:Kelch-like protein 26 n=1 Tax=Plakobranchus ocellatus TaxID=259542 RepID=A0AAV4CEU3_9GAST|nr:kelch-like protein 26 [Plakobranchus ocellatus]